MGSLGSRVLPHLPPSQAERRTPARLKGKLAAVTAERAAQGRTLTRVDLRAAPMVGGMMSSTVLTLLVIPALYALVKGWRLPHAADAVTSVKQQRSIVRHAAE